MQLHVARQDVALDVTAAAFVPDTEGVQASTGTSWYPVTEEFQREHTFYLAPKTIVLHNLLKALALDSQWGRVRMGSRIRCI